MRKRLTANLGWKVASFLIAVTIWMLIITVEDPTSTRDFTDITVEEINGEQITDADKAYTFRDGNTVSVRVSGKTSILGRVTPEDIVAVADLSKMSVTGAVVVDVSCPKYPSLEISPIGSSTVLTIDIENVIEKSLNVRVVTNGKPANDKYIGTGVATPNLITISGPASDVGNVEEAVVYVNVNSAMTNDISTVSDLVLLDADGQEIKSSTLNISQTRISVNVQIYNTKTVPINFEVTGEPPEGWSLVSAVFEPKTLTLAGPADELADIKEVSLINYDITDMTGNIEESMPVANYLEYSLPENVVMTDSEATVALMVDIEEIITKDFSIPLSRISIEGDDGYSYSLSNLNDSRRNITLSLSGAQSAIEGLSAEDINASLSVTGLDEGDYDIALEIEPIDDVEVNDDVYVHVVVTYNEDAG